jgi:cytochrome c oxidase subunit 3
MTQSAQAAMAETAPLLDGTPGVIADWSSDQRAFKKTPWGKAMMWIFLLSDTFIFSCFLISYGTIRMSTTIPWPNPSEVFALTIAGNHVPLLLIAIMTFVLITSSGTMALAVNFGYRKNKMVTFWLLLATALLGAPIGFPQGRTPSSTINLVHSKTCMPTNSAPSSAVASSNQNVTILFFR